MESWGRTVAASDSLYIYSDRVKTNQVLVVEQAFVCAPEREANDRIRIGVKSGGEHHILNCRAAAIAQQGLGISTQFYVGEGDQVFAYLPDADEGDSITLAVNGYLQPAAEWREANG